MSLQLYDDKKLVAAMKHRLGFDLHCPIFSRSTMLLVRRGRQFLKTYGVFLGFLLVLIIYGESTGSRQATIFLRQLLKIVADHDHVICERNGRKYRDCQSRKTMENSKTDLAPWLFIITPNYLSLSSSLCLP